MVSTVSHTTPFNWKAAGADHRRIYVKERIALHDVDVLLALMRYDCTERRAVSPATLRTYAAGVRTFLTWAFENGRSVLQPDPELALDFTRRLERQGVRPGTILTYRPAVSALYRALRWTGATTVDPMRDAPHVKDPVPRHEKRQPYSEAELRALLAVATPDEKVLVLLAGLGGLRNAEARAATWADIDWTAGTLLVRGKGQRVRRVYLARDMLTALQQARHRAPTRSRPDFLLPWADPDTVRSHLRTLCSRAGVPYEARAFHGLRHTAGTLLYRRTRSLDDVARHLGHSQIETSRVYAEHENSATRDALDSFRIGEG